MNTIEIVDKTRLSLGTHTSYVNELCGGAITRAAWISDQTHRRANATDLRELEKNDHRQVGINTSFI